MNKEIIINTDFIKLGSLLKLSGIISTGGSAKNLILSGQVKVNGQVSFMRGKKITEKDIVSINGIDITVKKDSL